METGAALNGMRASRGYPMPISKFEESVHHFFVCGGNDHLDTDFVCAWSLARDEIIATD